MKSGTAAIHLGLQLLGVQNGDEVLCQSLTFVASVNPVLYLGATPVFVGSEKETWNMCPDLLGECIEDRIAKGKMPKAKRIDTTWWNVKRTANHSKKPEFFQDLIETVSDAPRLEMFARREREGWDVWGNEVESSVAL